METYKGWDCKLTRKNGGVVKARVVNEIKLTNGETAYAVKIYHYAGVTAHNSFVFDLGETIKVIASRVSPIR